MGLLFKVLINSYRDHSLPKAFPLLSLLLLQLLLEIIGSPLIAMLQIGCGGGPFNAPRNAGLTKLLKKCIPPSHSYFECLWPSIFAWLLILKGLVNLPVDWKLRGVWAGLAGETAAHSDKGWAEDFVFITAVCWRKIKRSSRQDGCWLSSSW